MKKFFIAALSIILSFSEIYAAEIYVNNVTIPKEGTALMEVYLTNTDVECVAFQFEINLPQGIQPATDSNNSYILQKGSRISSLNVTIGLSNKGNNKYQFAGYQGSGLPVVFPGTEGQVVTIMLKTDATVNVGDVLNASLSDVRITDTSSRTHFLDNSSFTITVGEPDDGFIKFNETDTQLPVYTAGDRGNVRMTRTVRAGVWNTIVLPFTLTKANAEAVFGTDVKLAEFTGFTTEYDPNDDEDVTPDNIVINFATYTLSTRKPMTGGKPFLILVSKDVKEFEVEDVTLVGEVTDVEKKDNWNTKGMFTGSFVKTVVPADGLFISDNLFYYSSGSTNIKAFRGWFELGAVLDKETTDFGAKVRFTVDDEATAVEGIESGMAEGGVYTLQGVYLGDNVDINTLPKGVYIVGGKKMLVK